MKMKSRLVWIFVILIPIKPIDGEVSYHSERSTLEEAGPRLSSPQEPTLSRWKRFKKFFNKKPQISSPVLDLQTVQATDQPLDAIQTGRDDSLTQKEKEMLTSKEFEDTLSRDSSFLVKLKIRKKESSVKAETIRKINLLLNKVIKQKQFDSIRATILRDQFRIFLDANSTKILSMNYEVIENKINELAEKQAAYISEGIKEIINRKLVERYLNNYTRSSAKALYTKYLTESFPKSVASFKELLGIDRDLNKQETAMLEQLVKITFDEQVEKYTPIRSLDWKRGLPYDDGDGGFDNNGYGKPFSPMRELIASKEFRLRNFFSRKIKEANLKPNKIFVCYSFFEIYLEMHRTELKNVSDYGNIINEIISSVNQMQLPTTIEMRISGNGSYLRNRSSNSLEHIYDDYSYDPRPSYYLRDRIYMVMKYNNIEIPDFLGLKEAQEKYLQAQEAATKK
jgi:hypothetical protein